MLTIRALLPTDASAYQSLRLQGLAECPTAFSSSLAEEAGTPLQDIAARLALQADRTILGAFTSVTGAVTSEVVEAVGAVDATQSDHTQLVGVVGVRRETMKKLAHKAFIWGAYVAPSARRLGAGRRLLTHALAHAASHLDVQQVNLGVNANNVAAHALYVSIGFVPFGFERAYMLHDGVPQDEIHMVCILPIPIHQ